MNNTLRCGLARVTFPFFIALALALVPALGKAQLIPIASEFPVNDDPTCAYELGVVARPDGGFAVLWSDLIAVHGKFYDADGIALGAEQTLVTPGTGGISLDDAAATLAGEHIVSWTEYDGDIQVRAGRFASDGSPVGSAFDVSQVVAGFGQAELDLDDQGNFVVVWLETPAGVNTLQARRFAFDGSPMGAQFTVDSGNGVGAGDVAKDPDSGEFAVVWYDNGDLAGQRYDSTGTPVGAEFVASLHMDGLQQEPSVSMSSAGELLVAWWGNTPTSPSEFRAAVTRLDSSNTPQEEIEVGGSTTRQDRAKLDGSRDGGSFAVAMTERPAGMPVGPTDVKAAFNTATDQGVASSSAGDQSISEIAIDEAERVTIAWLDDSDTNDCAEGVKAARGQLIRPALEAQSGVVHSSGTQRAWKYYLVSPDPGVYEVMLSGLTGDADLYVQIGGVPDLFTYECRSFNGGISSEVCIVSTDGTPFVVGVNGFAAAPISFDLTIGEPTPLFTDGFESGDTSAWSATVN